jgi:hypothetical protein
VPYGVEGERGDRIGMEKRRKEKEGKKERKRGTWIIQREYRRY